MVVGGGGGGGDYVQETELQSYDKHVEEHLPAKSVRGGGQKRNVQSPPDAFDESRPQGISSGLDVVLPDGDRPIRPKAAENYLDPDPDAPSEYAAVGNGQQENFGPGRHPLEGISNFQELPAPEALQGKYRCFEL